MKHSPEIFESASDCIYTNLAVEDYLFRTLKADKRRLLLWKNQAAVVLGRYQNPYLECAVTQIQKDGVRLARRQSGGGTVWHDEGNLCFSIMGPSSDFNRQDNIRFVCRALQELGIPARHTEKLDIMVNDKKVSGSAFRECGSRSFHHGTLLVASDLSRLNSYLRSNGTVYRSKGIASRRSAVANLSDFSEKLDLQTLKNQLSAVFGGSGHIQKLDPNLMQTDSMYRDCYEQLRSWEWIFGKSPPFTRLLSVDSMMLQIHVKNGLIISIEEEISPLSKNQERYLYNLLSELLRSRLLNTAYDRLEAELRGCRAHLVRAGKKKAAELVNCLESALES